MNQIAGKRNERPDIEVMDVIRTYADEQDWWQRHYWWPVAEDPGGAEYHLDCIPVGATLLYLEADDWSLAVYPDLTLPAGLTVQGNANISARIRLPEDMTVTGFIEFLREIDDPRIILPESLDAEEIRVGSADDLARPIPAHLIPRIKCKVEKLSGHSFNSMRWVDELHPLEDDEPEPGPGM